MLSQLTLRLPQRDGHFVRPLRGAPARQRELPTRCAARPRARVRRHEVSCVACAYCRRLHSSSRACSDVLAAQCGGVLEQRGWQACCASAPASAPAHSGREIRTLCRIAPWSQHCALACSYRHFGRIKDAQEAYTKVLHARCSRPRSTIRLYKMSAARPTALHADSPACATAAP